ncbi:SMP-30/gluconolactonase/LRE family protein [Dehalococcoidia bacterium]|nr:SMP-30/gluconolactonase/LRE family protein [Dehalococcoidia bacterium]
MTGIFEAYSKEFNTIITPESKLEKICDGLGFTEGPTWFSESNYLLFSDIRASRHRWSDTDGMTTYQWYPQRANGSTRDQDGLFVTCGHANRNVFRTELDGSITIIAEEYMGGRLNSPNDIVCKSDGTLWFTDPPYMIKPEEREQSANYVFRLDPDGTLHPVIDSIEHPNGLAFSPDERILYVAEAFRDVSNIQMFDVNPDNTVSSGRFFCSVQPPIPDGFRVDTDGRIYTTAGDGIQIFNAAGDLLGKILMNPHPANCTFGDRDRRTLYITAHESVYRLRLGTQGAAHC